MAMMLAMAGITAAVLPAGTPDADVIATHGRAFSIQVKTTGAAGREVVDMKPVRILRSDFLVIVALKMRGRYRRESGTPVAYVLPREVVREAWAVGGYEHDRRPGPTAKPGSARHPRGPHRGLALRRRSTRRRD